MDSLDLKVERLDHLGLVASTIKDLKLIEMIDERIPTSPQETITTGEAVAGMILNGLGFTSEPLYLSPEFFSDKPLSNLFDRNDNKLENGRTLSDYNIESGSTLVVALDPPPEKCLTFLALGYRMLLKSCSKLLGELAEASRKNQEDQIISKIMEEQTLGRLIKMMSEKPPNREYRKSFKADNYRNLFLKENAVYNGDVYRGIKKVVEGMWLNGRSLGFF